LTPNHVGEGTGGLANGGVRVHSPLCEAPLVEDAMHPQARPPEGLHIQQ